jgi:hypothetical protein
LSKYESDCVEAMALGGFVVVGVRAMLLANSFA